MLTDTPSTKSRKSPRTRSTNQAVARKRWYSDTQKIEAVQTYLMLGNASQTAKLLNIPLVTFNVWRYSEWWKDIEADLKSEETIVFSNRLQKIINKSIEVVEDRLENGEFVYNQKTGKLVRKPVLLKDAHKVATDLIERKQKLQRPDNYKVAEEGVAEKLEKLAKQFEQFANKTKVEVTDVIFVKEDANAVSEEREEGLQEGTPVGAQEQTGEGS